MHEHQLSGRPALDAATSLLRRLHRVDPTAALLHPADLHWWWRAPRSTDQRPQLFWFDAAGQPEAAVIFTDWGDGVAMDTILMPGAGDDAVAQVIERGLAHGAEAGFVDPDVVIDPADTRMLRLLGAHGFEIDPESRHDVVLTSLRAEARPPVSPLPAGYRLSSREETAERPHHMRPRNGPQVEERLRQSALYRPALDLFVLDADGQVAAYGLFWLDPETASALVEPMRTEPAHQRRGLGRHLLTAGVERLAQAGAGRITLCFKPSNEAARGLYLGVGFLPYKRTAVLTRRRSPG